MSFHLLEKFGDSVVEFKQHGGSTNNPNTSDDGSETTELVLDDIDEDDLNELLGEFSGESKTLLIKNKGIFKAIFIPKKDDKFSGIK